MQICKKYLMSKVSKEIRTKNRLDLIPLFLMSKVSKVHECYILDAWYITRKYPMLKVLKEIKKIQTNIEGYI